MFSSGHFVHLIDVSRSPKSGVTGETAPRLSCAKVSRWYRSGLTRETAPRLSCANFLFLASSVSCSRSTTREGFGRTYVEGKLMQNGEIAKLHKWKKGFGNLGYSVFACGNFYHYHFEVETEFLQLRIFMFNFTEIGRIKHLWKRNFCN